MGDLQESLYSLRAYRLPRSADYQRIARTGTKVGSTLLVMRSVESPDGKSRFAFVVRKKSGNAVFRNRVKRILRQEFFSKSPLLGTPRWAMVIFQGSKGETRTDQIHNAVGELLRKAGWLL